MSPRRIGRRRSWYRRTAFLVAAGLAGAGFGLAGLGDVAGAPSPAAGFGGWSGAVSPPEHRVPADVDPTGTADVTAALQAVIDAVPDGATIRFRPGARYRVDGTLVVAARQDLIVEGEGATLVAGTEGTADRSHLSIERSDRVRVRDLGIRGAHPAGGSGREAFRRDRAFQHGIRILGSRDVELDRVRVSDAFGDLVYVGPDADHQWSERVWIRRSVLARNGRQGIAVTAGRDVVIEQNIIVDTTRATIDLEPGAEIHGVENVHILDNQIGPGRLRFVAAHGNGPVNDVVIARNVLTRKLLQIDVAAADHLDRRRNFHVIDNRGDLVAHNPPIRFTRIDGVVVRGNAQSLRDAEDAGVLTERTCGIVVAGNDFGENPAHAARGPVCDDAPPPPPPARPTIAAPDPARHLPEPEPPPPATDLPVETAPTTVPTTSPRDRSSDDAAAVEAPPPGPPPDESAAEDESTGGPGVAFAAILAGLALAVVAVAGWRRRATRGATAPDQPASTSA